MTSTIDPDVERDQHARVAATGALLYAASAVLYASFFTRLPRWVYHAARWTFL